MIYRILGIVSLVVGGVFGLVSLLVLLPFIDNFNTSLLVLCGVFAILAYVFLAIGWQLLHPPSDKPSSRTVDATGVPAAPTVIDQAVQATSPADAEGTPLVAEAAVGSPATVVATPVIIDDADDDLPVSPARPILTRNGGGTDRTHSSLGGFKKPGAPVPHK